ncbi:hypothetical protein BZG36_04996 [Bifiguratus adelaidae]|uniref:Beta-xylosidase n=1 Tax=Bifiguratus adelaidae TaxID=1938954 RepID=A0A261XUW8_9FUNG|nr:hypothetical protein BZG36_04996 [Bifiguratus adelaidae]
MNTEEIPITFNAQHSPIGAFASFTLGYPGAKGGLAIASGMPADQHLYIGLETPDGQYETFPFYGASGDQAEQFSASAEWKPSDALLKPFEISRVRRDYGLTTDTWRAGDITFSVISPVKSIPDPDKSSAQELRSVLLPAVYVQVTVDNTGGTSARRAFFGYQSRQDARREDAMYHLQHHTDGQLVGFGQGQHLAVVSCNNGKQVVAANGFSVEKILCVNHTENWNFALGQCSLMLMDTPPGKKKTYTFALCFYQGGNVTTGLLAQYYYTRFWSDIWQVAAYAVQHAESIIQSWKVPDHAQLFEHAKLSSHQRFQLIHAIHSYYGSTELLLSDGRPIWIVNEGEYRMMNTSDLMLDHVFFETLFNPWTVRNTLDFYLERYSYVDRVFFPGQFDRLYPGGLSFTHDQGMSNAFSRKGYSAYESVQLTDCFSYMTQEELTNWILTAAVYIERSKDKAWARQRLEVLKQCFESMLHRDHPDPAKRNGLMSLDSDRTMGGSEITTYDSLDPSLAQARENTYIGGKCWASYVLLSKLFGELGESELAQHAQQQAIRSATSITAGIMAEKGYIPAILDTQHEARIIPAIEALIYPFMAGVPEAVDLEGPYGDYVSTLKTHLLHILVKDVCLFPDGGWKLSSTSINSWLSKIYLNQYIARAILNLPWDASGHASDVAHVQWLTNGSNAYWAWSDQMYAGVPKGSLYYPRGVTAILWCFEQ